MVEINGKDTKSQSKFPLFSIAGGVCLAIATLIVVHAEILFWIISIPGDLIFYPRLPHLIPIHALSSLLAFLLGGIGHLQKENYGKWISLLAIVVFFVYYLPTVF
jgi:hypothetical protein